MRRLLAILATTIAMGVGFITLVGLLVGDDLGFASALVQFFAVRQMAGFFLQMTVITAAMTLIIGLLNLFSVHFGRVIRARRGWHNSLILLLSALIVYVLVILERLGVLTTTPGQPTPSAILLDSVQISIESALAALVLFALVYGAYRMLRRRVTPGALLFVLSLLIVLLGALPLPGAGISFLATLRDWWLNVPVSAGLRGLLLGIALATVVAGMRVIIGQDRAYRE